MEKHKRSEFCMLQTALGHWWQCATSGVRHEAHSAGHANQGHGTGQVEHG